MATPPKTRPRGARGGEEASGTDRTDGPEPEVTLHKRELLARVAAATGEKRPQVKQIVEATLAILGQALADGEALHLAPLGKLRIVRTREAGASEVLTLKLRRKGGGLSAEESEES